MAETLTDILFQLQEVLNRNPSGERLEQLVRKIKILPNISPEELAELYTIMSQILGYGVNRSQKKSSGRPFVKNFPTWLAIDILEKTLYEKEKPSLVYSWKPEEAESYLFSFFRYLDGFSGYPDTIYPIHVYWNIYLQGYPTARSVLQKYLQQPSDIRPRPMEYIQTLEKAVELYQVFKNIESTVKTGSVNVEIFQRWKEFFSLLDDDGLVRARAAKVLGLLYRAGAETLEEDMPSLWEMLRLIGEKEKQKAGVLGPFIDGFDASCMGIRALHYAQEPKKADFDVKAFVVDVLLHSPDEPYFPNTQSFEFYAHEYFENDAESLKKLLKAGKEEIVLDAIACSSHMDGREELLKLLLQSPKAGIVARAREILNRK